MKSFDEFKGRMQELAGIKSEYAIEVIIHSKNLGLIVEHNSYQQFAKTRNVFTYHPADKNIPVKGHYHIYPSNSKKEIYAVNVDGTAHHKSNRGYEVPKKEAQELIKLGVSIPDNRILENQGVIINEGVENLFSIFLVIKN